MHSLTLRYGYMQERVHRCSHSGTAGWKVEFAKRMCRNVTPRHQSDYAVIVLMTPDCWRKIGQSTKYNTLKLAARREEPPHSWKVLRWRLQKYRNHGRKYSQQAVRVATQYVSAPASWQYLRIFSLGGTCSGMLVISDISNKLTFDLESGVWVTCDVGYLCANFSLPRPLCSHVRPDVRDRQTSDVK